MLRLILGGYAQGKLSYAKTLLDAPVIDETNYKEMSCKGYESVIVNHLHLIIKDLLADGTNDEVSGAKLAQEWMDKLCANAKECIVVSDEIGNGIIPLEKQDRILREVVGRIQVELAKKADCVERVLCQIPQRIK